jgi:hypothetical protein
MKIRQVGAELFHVDTRTDTRTDGRTDGRTERQTDRHNEATSRFSKFCQHAKKLYSFLVSPTRVIFHAHLILVITLISGSI